MQHRNNASGTDLLEMIEASAEDAILQAMDLVVTALDDNSSQDYGGETLASLAEVACRVAATANGLGKLLQSGVS